MITVRHRLVLTLSLLVLPLVSGAACESTTKSAKAPASPTEMPTAEPTPTMPGAPQLTAPDTPPGIDHQMNAQSMALYQQGMAAFAGAELQQAEGLFLQATQADPRAYQAYYSLAVVQERLGKSSALQSYRKAFNLVPEHEKAIIGYGLLLAKEGKLSEADSFLTDMRGRLSKSANIAAALAEVKSLRKDTGSAQTIAQEALKIDPDCKAAMMTIARDHYRNRRLDLSLYALKAILDGFDEDNPARDKNNAEAHLLRGVIWSEQGFRGDAMAAFRKTLELRPDMVSARLRLATYLLEAGSAAEALPLLQRAVKYDAQNLAAHLSLGDAYRLTGAYPQALKEFEWVRERDSGLASVHYNLGLLYLFAQSIPGLLPLQQVEAATASLKRYEQLRKKTDPDVSELLNRASLKKAMIEANNKAAQPRPKPQPTPPPPAEGEADAGAEEAVDKPDAGVEEATDQETDEPAEEATDETAEDG